MGSGEKPVLNVANNTLSSSVTVIVGDNDNDQQILEDLNSNTSIEDVVIATPPPTEPPTEPPTYPPFTCEEGKIDVYIRRTRNLYSEEESFSLFEGPYGLDTAVYNSTYSDVKVTIDQVCLSSMCHTLVMKDSYGDGWSEGSTVAFIRENGNEVHEYSMHGGAKLSEVIYIGGECPTTPPPTEPPTTPPPTPAPTTPVPTADLTGCEMYTVERIFGNDGVEETVSLYWESMDLQPLWTLSNQYSNTAVEVCIPSGRILIVMSDRYVDMTVIAIGNAND